MFVGTSFIERLEPLRRRTTERMLGVAFGISHAASYGGPHIACRAPIAAGVLTVSPDLLATLLDGPEVYLAGGPVRRATVTLPGGRVFVEARNTTGSMIHHADP